MTTHSAYVALLERQLAEARADARKGPQHLIVGVIAGLAIGVSFTAGWCW